MMAERGDQKQEHDDPPRMRHKKRQPNSKAFQNKDVLFFGLRVIAESSVELRLINSAPGRAYLVVKNAKSGQPESRKAEQ
jgi:hypothetical protein